ncbi:glycerate kinase type-2 family protein [Aureimonas jatrophae]|uniref:Hydroxypyruvate reductase n=1 Tax=Aureimonas jatrophae TaxID=1166073 RepID=A0A1H0C5B4_9HYPH|nr:glycerate kinase [Aureimonas jatrophae]MBB3949074.1 hydroxypyruvate reductase [Aureimonas jatrophae]SDN53074.1 hydroxypyruvate reductase [Aureimonas jatrophae]
MASGPRVDQAAAPVARFQGDTQARAILAELFAAAVSSADPMQVLAPALPERPRGRCVVVGAGKSAAVMAQAVEAAWTDVDLSGVVVTRYGHGAPTRRIEVLEAAHPVPDAASEQAARRILLAVQGLGPEDLVLALISGGGSSLMALPAGGLTLDDKRAVNRLLLASGLGINEMNQVRRRLSAIKGGRLAEAAHPARVATLVISDVPGDDPRAIASGPTVYDPEAAADLSALARRLGPALPEAARRLLVETPLPRPPFASDVRMIATPQMALEAAAAVARRHGLRPILLGDALEGEAREAGTLFAGMARSVRRHAQPAAAPAVLLSGGETTVTIGSAEPGRGGRNTEFLLALAVALRGERGISAISADTDGIDGTEDAAGAVITADTLERARRAGLDPAAFLSAHDSYTLFQRLGDLVVTGPTLTNVNDFRAVLVLPEP